MRLKSTIKTGFVLSFLSIFLAGCSAADVPLVGRFFKQSGGFSGNASLTYWGLFESPESMTPLINDYKEKHSGVTVDYQQKSYATLSQYKETLINRLREGQGADILRIHQTWLKEFQPYLAPLPAKIMSREDYASAFFSVIREGSSIGDIIYGIPLMYDGLMLLGNKKMLDEFNLALPKTWDEFRQTAALLTKIDSQTRRIVQAGSAFGAYGNIPHSVDVLQLMFLQSNLRIPEDLGTQAAADALTFYTNFVVVDKVWDEALPNSIISFARGQVAMIFAPSWRILDIKNLNPSLEIVTANAPQVPNLEGVTSNEIALPSFWIEVVSKDSKFKEAAFDFLAFLSSGDPLRKLYALQGQNRPFGEPYPRKDLAESLKSDPYLAPLVESAPKARLAPFNDSVGNDPYVDALGAAINSVVRGGDPRQALSNAQKSIEQLQTAGSSKTKTTTK